MCGFLGITGSSISREHFLSGFEAIKRRGPDFSKIFEFSNAIIGHHRLSIIDTSSGANQPMKFENCYIVFNGEIYNYKELRVNLKNSGIMFETESDTEVLLKGYVSRGVSFLKEVRGMFSFAIYNEFSHEVILARDPVGVKPLYFLKNDRVFAFGSQFSSLLPFVESNHFDQLSLVEFFQLGYNSGDRTVLSQIRKLQPGHFLQFADGKVSIQRYYDFNDANDNKLFSVDDLLSIAKNAFSSRLISDVPVGALFSGGVDSTFLIKNLSEAGHQVDLFTLGFEEDDFDESNYAIRIAKLLNQKVDVLKIPSFEIAQRIDDFFEIFDEPFSDNSGIPTSIISEYVKEKGYKVLLSADGGDELFGGYNHYSKFAQFENSFYNSLFFKLIIKCVPKDITESDFFLNSPFNLFHRIGKFRDVTSSKPEEVFQYFNSCVSTSELAKLFSFKIDVNCNKIVRTGNSYFDFMDWDFQNYLPENILVKTDRSSMYHGVECRDPFLDIHLISKIRGLRKCMVPNDFYFKGIIKRNLYSKIDSDLINRKKRGFNVPLELWMKTFWRNRILDTLTVDKIGKIGIFNEHFIKFELNRFFSSKDGNRYNSEFIWRLFVFVNWHEKRISKR